MHFDSTDSNETYTSRFYRTFPVVIAATVGYDGIISFIMQNEVKGRMSLLC